MGICTCNSAKCACAVASGSGITIIGNGTDRNPYIAKAAGAANLIPNPAPPGAPVVVIITGTGTAGDPWVVSIETTGSSATQHIYTAGDTWTRPGGSLAHVVVIGGGGGGGHASGWVETYGGGGGYGGNLSSSVFTLADLPASVEIGVGGGGSGATSRSQPVGTDGGDSWFGDFLFAQGGSGGRGQVSPPIVYDYVKLGGTRPEGGEGGFGAVRGDVAETPYDRIAPGGGGLGSGGGVAQTDGGSPAPGTIGWAGDGGKGASNIIGPGGPTPGYDGELYGGGGGGGHGGEGDSRGGSGAPGVVVVTVF